MDTDGFTSVENKISEEQAINLIMNFDMEHLPSRTSTETNFTYIKTLKESIDFKVKFKPPDTFSFIVSGSLHKYFHKRNDNDFFYSELQDVKEDLHDSVKMDIVEIDRKGRISTLSQIPFSLKKLEVGINFTLDVGDTPHQFLQDNLLLHKKRQFKCDDGKVFCCCHENFHLKIYAKDETKNLLRFEIVLLSRELRKYKIFTLSDLVEKKLMPIFSRLKCEANEVIFADGINIHSAKNITRRQREKLMAYTHGWWHNDFKIDKRNCKNSRERKKLTQELYRLKKDCKKIFTEKAVGIKQSFVDALSLKIDDFLLKNAMQNHADFRHL